MRTINQAADGMHQHLRVCDIIIPMQFSYSRIFAWNFAFCALSLAYPNSHKETRVRSLGQLFGSIYHVFESLQITFKKSLRWHNTNTEEGKKSRTYAAHVRAISSNGNLLPNIIKKGMLVLRYDNRSDNRKDKKFLIKWEGLF